jgi:hypothetical protein
MDAARTARRGHRDGSERSADRSPVVIFLAGFDPAGCRCASALAGRAPILRNPDARRDAARHGQPVPCGTGAEWNDAVRRLGLVPRVRPHHQRMTPGTANDRHFEPARRAAVEIPPVPDRTTRSEVISPRASFGRLVEMTSSFPGGGDRALRAATVTACTSCGTSPLLPSQERYSLLRGSKREVRRNTRPLPGSCAHEPAGRGTYEAGEVGACRLPAQVLALCGCGRYDRLVDVT